jgi:hypothetical protein
MRYGEGMTPDTSHELDLETIFEGIGTEAEMEAIAIQSMLEASGFAAVVVGSSALPTLPFAVQVPREQAEDARKRLEEAKAAGAAGAEEAENVVTVHAAGLVTETVPCLPSLNFDETLAFYQQLGFNLNHRYGEDYLIVQREQVQIHFWHCDEEVSENSGCYVRTPDAKALHAEFAASGVERLTDVELKPWNMIEFNVVDSSGNLLRFGQAA